MPKRLALSILAILLLGSRCPGRSAVRRSDIGCVLLMIPKQGIMRYNMINLKVNRCSIKYM